jgi:hypothetical protein
LSGTDTPSATPFKNGSCLVCLYLINHLEDPITGDLYQVQIKSHATAKDFYHYASYFSGSKYRRLFFIVHSPDENLLKIKADEFPKVELILSRKIAEMTIDLGLLNWLMSKIQ